MIEAEIPEWLVKEARMNSRSPDEANEYVCEKAKDMDVKLVWPDS